MTASPADRREMRCEAAPPGAEGVAGVLLVSAAALVVALFYTGHLPLIDRDEGRYAETAREMFVSGDWLVPRLFGVPYLEKPPLFYWLTALAYGLTGVDELGARLVSALGGAGGVLGVGLFARRWFGARAGILASAILATSGLYFILARVAITDMLFTVLLAGSLMTYFTAAAEERSLTWFWLLAAGATLTKGPVAPVLCGLVVLLHLAESGRFDVLRTRRFWNGFPLFALVVLPWFALVELRYPSFLGFYVYKEHMLRVAGDEHRHGLWWYAPWLALGFLPWTPVLVAALSPIRSRLKDDSSGGRAARFALAWAFLVFVFFSVPRGKLVPYILPMFPPLAVLLGDALARSTGGREESARLRLAFLSVGGGLLLALAAVPIGLRRSPVLIPPTLVVAIVAITVTAAGALLYAARARSTAPVTALAVSVAVSVAVLECMAVMVASPIASYLTTVPVIDELRGRLEADDQVALYSGYFPNVPFYLGRIPYFVSGNRELDFGVSLEGPGAWIVGDFHELEERVGGRRLFIVLRTRDRDIQRLLSLPGETRLLHRGRSSSLIEHRP